ncbi:MAG: endonuclease/exonuclease/phosphatase family protein [Clostridia bacterium]|nr:endonuclease/exonuclease/phosphatase family protein [Clostridia bacterium]
MKKINLIVSALLLCGMLLSCGNGKYDDISTDPAVLETADVGITAEEMASYELIRPDKASKELIRTATSVVTALREDFPDLNYRSDYYREGVDTLAIGRYEILIGATNRPESAEFLGSLRADDYGFSRIGDKIVIAGHSDDTVAKACELFLEAVENRLNPGVYYQEDMETVIRGEYALDALSLGGIQVQEFEIRYGDRDYDETAAYKLREKIAEACGYVLNVTEDGDGEHVLYVGKTDTAAADGITLSYTERGVTLSGADRLSQMQAVLYFDDMIGSAAEKSEERSIDIALPAGQSENPEPDYDVMSAMSFNVLYKDPENRYERVVKIIGNYSPDTFGVQEAAPMWMTLLNRELKDTYAYVGNGRDGGTQGEYNAIFYKKDKFTLIESGTRYLTDTPKRKSKVPESSLNRIYTYALLEKISDGEKILFVNTHFDHTSDIARTKQAKHLAEFLLEYSEYPIVLTGDFNTASGSAAYEEILEGGVENSMNLASEKEPGSTYTNYGKSKSVIDFIFVTEEDIVVNSCRVCGEKIDGEYPSDHHPVYIEYVNCN